MKNTKQDTTTMILIASQYKQTHYIINYKMQFSGIKSYYCFTAESYDVDGDTEDCIYNHGLSNNA